MSDDPMPASFVAPDPAELAPLFPGYEIDSLIATGGMGAVYHAVQKSLERAVAIKILPHEFSRDSAFCTGFAAEAKAMARLNHPNLIGVYDFGEIAGMLYIVMEYVPGKSLFHSAHRTAIDPAEVNRIVTGICNGLAHAHENGIIHRDIKPSNILLDLNANPKIGDFGLARPADHKVQEGEQIFGTPHYTAPEVINSPASVDCRADIFSVGVLLHELLTGRLPADDHRPASAISHCDPRFDAIIRRATDPFPSHRYSSAAEIANDLHTIATSVGPKVLHTASPRSSRQPGRHRVIPGIRSKKSSAGSGLIIILIVVTIAALTFKYFADQKAALQTRTEDTSSPPPASSPAESPAARDPLPVPPPAPNPTPIPDRTISEATDSPPNPNPESHPIPEPTPIPGAAPAPEFDVTGFLVRARSIMRSRAAPVIQARDQKLKQNLETFEKSLDRAARSISIKASRQSFDAALGEFIKDCEQSGNRIPTDMPAELLASPSVKDLHADSLEEQETLENTMIRQLSQLSATYILGIEKQIERLKSGYEPVAIKLLEEEIEFVRDDEEYFVSLMLTDESAGDDP